MTWQVMTLVYLTMIARANFPHTATMGKKGKRDSMEEDGEAGAKKGRSSLEGAAKKVRKSLPAIPRPPSYPIAWHVTLGRDPPVSED